MMQETETEKHWPLFYSTWWLCVRICLKNWVGVLFLLPHSSKWFEWYQTDQEACWCFWPKKSFFGSRFSVSVRKRMVPCGCTTMCACGVCVSI